MSKIGLVLSGGGTRGLAHIGVLRVLDKLNIKISAIAGTSIGALVGAFYAAGISTEKMEEFALQKRIYMDFNFSLRRFAIHDISKFKKRVENYLQIKQFAHLKIPLYINAVNITQGREEVFSTGNIFTAIRASMAIPGILTPAKIRGHYYVDGGMLNQHPFSILPADIKRYIIVNVSPFYRLRSENMLGRVNLLETTLKMMQAEMTKMRLKKLKDDQYILIQPQVHSYHMIESAKKFKDIIHKGELAARRQKQEIIRKFR
ncbi:patatin-like phospholipase family protein [Patescibacteria group bacterium]